MGLFNSKPEDNGFLILGNSKQFSKAEWAACHQLNQGVNMFLNNYLLWTGTIKSVTHDVEGIRTLAQLCNTVWTLCYRQGLFIGPRPTLVNDQWYYSSADGTQELELSTCNFLCFPNDLSTYQGERLTSDLKPYIYIGDCVGKRLTVSQWLSDETLNVPTDENVASKLVDEFKKNLDVDLVNIKSFVMRLKAELMVHGIE